MPVSSLHLLRQGPVLGALGRSAAQALADRVLRRPRAAAPSLPGPLLEREVAPLPEGLLDDYVRHVGGDPAAYRGRVPPHLFPQWSFPLATRTLDGLPYPLLGVMNYGCQLAVHADIPRGELLTVRARLEQIDADERRAIMRQRVTTSTRTQADALVADFFVFVPLKRRAPAEPGGGPGRDKPRVPSAGQVRELARWKLGDRAGLDYAKLTGDVNPIHWIPAYARAFGFKHVILHGFATLARAAEGLNRGLFAGDTRKLSRLDVRFTRPLVLPARVGLYVTDDQRVFVGDAADGPAYLSGHFNRTPESTSNDHGD